MQKSKNKSKLFKVGNSFGLRPAKQGKEKMNAQPGDEYKPISPDGKMVTFKKKETVTPQTQKLIDKIFNEDSDLLNELKDL